MYFIRIDRKHIFTLLSLESLLKDTDVLIGRGALSFGTSALITAYRVLTSQKISHNHDACTKLWHSLGTYDFLIGGRKKRGEGGRRGKKKGKKNEKMKQQTLRRNNQNLTNNRDAV